ncbi:MAG: ABC transporter ATP-binding protein [Bacteroidales bacterium]|nr:ABC transporter ATP-binding protein [Bacteroidales bacterium]MCM1147233.1 ABC transporter ATP-binding protein [Bacteroidales bacterium]MCM1207200.1 ABC transporter ATP-binding protein [Bacillota bacterium]MCM1509737.1 ABC transporter ATP-binding protein [Clostridium sp.]
MEIRVQNVSFKYKGSKREVLSNMHLELRENRICGLLGKNGVGKSTLLYLIAGLLRPSKGLVTVGDMESAERKPEMLEEVFFVSEEFELPSVTLSEYVSMNAPFYPRFSQELLSQCLTEFGLQTDLKLSELSMGQKKKVFMSFALATRTKILLMDEPTNGLDIPSKAQFRKAVSGSMDDDRIIIISTHQVHDVEQLLDHIVIMSNEGILLDKSTQEICDEYVFETRLPQDMGDAVYGEPSLQGNIVMAPRGDRPETPLNLEILFNAVTQGK